MTEKQLYQFQQIKKQATEAIHNDMIDCASDLSIRTTASIIYSYAALLMESAKETPEEAKRRAANQKLHDMLGA